MSEEILFPTKVQIEIAELQELREKAELGEALEIIELRVSPISTRVVQLVGDLVWTTATPVVCEKVEELLRGELQSAKAKIEKGGE